MLQKLELTPDHVLGFRIKGKLDFDAITKKSRHLVDSVKQNGEICILLEVPDQDGLEFWEMWKSIRYALAHFRQNIGDIHSIAVVSDAEWVHRASRYDYQVLSGAKEKMFSSSSKHKAIQWVSKREVSMAAA